MFDILAIGQNTITKKDGWNISYNPHTDCGAETAIIIDGYYYILLGNHVDLFSKVKTKGGAKKKFNKLVKDGYEKSSWSD